MRSIIPNFETKNHQNCQKIKLYGSPTTRELKKKRSSRLVGGAETGSWGGEDSYCCGGTETGGVWDKQGRQSNVKQTLRPYITTQIN